MAEETTWNDVVQTAIKSGRTDDIDSVANELGYKTPDAPPAPPAAPPADPPANNGDEPPATQAPAAEPNPGDQSPAIDFKEFDADDLSGLKSRFEQLRQAEKGYNELKAKFEEAAPILEAAPFMQNPFANEHIHKVNTFVKKTGISDWNVANDIISTSADTIKADPLKAIVIADVLSDPALASVGIDKLKRVAAGEFGIDLNQDPSEWSEDVKDRLEIRAMKALKIITDKQPEWQINDIFAETSQRAKQHKDTVEQRQNGWKESLPRIKDGFKDGLKYEVEVEGLGKIKAEAAISASDLDPILQSILPTLGSLDPNDDGHQKVNNTVSTFLRSAKVQDLIQSAIKDYDAKFRATVEQEIRQKIHNGGDPTPPQRPGNPGGNKVVNEALAEIQRQFAPKPRQD